MTDLEFRKLLKDNFTRDQIIWFASNGSYDPDNTEGEIKADVARQLFDAKMDKTPEQTDKLLKFINGPKQTYDLQSFAQAAGFKDQKIGNKTLTAADQFYASYPNASRSDRELWNAGITGVFGYDALDKLDRVMASEKRNREYAAQRKFDDRSLAGKIIDAVISPRATEARAEGREPSDKDKWLDRTENALMALPFSGVAKAIGRVARVPSIASKILNKGAYTAATVGVPHAMEALDAKFYSPEENLDRSAYRESDAVLGSLTNVVAPKALELKFGRLNRYLPGSKGKPGMSEMGKAQLDQAIADGLWTKPKKETVKAVTDYNAIQQRGGEVDKLMPEFHEKLASQIETGVPTNSVLDQSRARGIFKYMAENTPNNSAQNYIEAGFVQKAADDMGYEGAEQIMEGLTKSPNFDDILSFSDQVIKDANTMDMLRYRNPKLATAVDAALEAGSNWGINKYGSKRDADIILGGVSRMLGSIDPSLNLSKKLEDSRKEDIEEQRNEVKKSQAKQILETKELEAEDREWLNKLIKNPKMMEGYGEGGSSKFKNWLLLRGQDILRGTELFRPTYEVE